jgi:hypothetical protein
MFTNKTQLNLAGLAIALMVGSANAGVITIVDVYGHNERSNYSGTIDDMIIGSGMNGNDNDGSVTWPDSDPSTWTATSTNYGAEWQSIGLLDDTTSVNGKIGWTAFDLGGAVTNLDELYLWNVRENTGRAVNEYNVYYATSPTGLVHGPTGGSSNNDYDFANSGWTKLNGSVLTMNNRTNNPNGSAAPNAVLDLGGVTAQYIAVEILSNGGDTGRAGLAEVGVTATEIPEPASIATGLFGLTLIAVRRKR